MMNRSVSEEPSDRLFIAFRLKKIELRYNPVYNLKIHKMQEHVSHVADGVDVIRDATVQLGKETDEIGKDIKNLSDIAQRNEDTVKGTISFSDEVLGTVGPRCQRKSVHPPMIWQAWCHISVCKK